MQKATVSTIADIIDAINDMNSAEIMNLNNVYCECNRYADDEIFYNDEETLSLFFGENILKAIQATQYGKYNYHDEFIQFNGYGNLDSFSRLTADNLPNSVESVALFIFENQDDFCDFFDFE